MDGEIWYAAERLRGCKDVSRALRLVDCSPREGRRDGVLLGGAHMVHALVPFVSPASWRPNMRSVLLGKQVVSRVWCCHPSEVNNTMALCFVPFYSGRLRCWRVPGLHTFRLPFYSTCIPPTSLSLVSLSSC